MIEIGVEDYCSDCMKFSPVSDNTYYFGQSAKVNHKVICEHRNLCKYLLKHLSEEKEKNGYRNYTEDICSDYTLTIDEMPSHTFGCERFKEN